MNRRLIILSVILGVMLCVLGIQQFAPATFNSILTSAVSRFRAAPAQTGSSSPTIATLSTSTTTATAASTTISVPIIQTGVITGEEIISLTNTERLENGNLKPLTENADLDAAAETKLKDMFAQQYFDHISPDGHGPGYVAEQAGYEYVVEGENLALGDFKSTQDLLDAWMASPGHRANILNVRYTNMGAAVGEGMFDGKLTYLAVQEFGLPLSTCPAIDTGLYGAIQTNETQANSLNTELTGLKQGLDELDAASSTSAGSYGQAVTHYDADVARYNGVLTRLKAEIQTYNAEVEAFNACIAG